MCTIYQKKKSLIINLDTYICNIILIYTQGRSFTLSIYIFSLQDVRCDTEFHITWYLQHFLVCLTNQILSCPNFIITSDGLRFRLLYALSRDKKHESFNEMMVSVFDNLTAQTELLAASIYFLLK